MVYKEEKCLNSEFLLGFLSAFLLIWFSKIFRTYQFKMESIQYLQTTAQNTGLYVTTSVLCIHNFLLGFCFVYAGVTMPYHQVFFCPFKKAKPLLAKTINYFLDISFINKPIVSRKNSFYSILIGFYHS